MKSDVSEVKKKDALQSVGISVSHRIIGDASQEENDPHVIVRKYKINNYLQKN